MCSPPLERPGDQLLLSLQSSLPELPKRGRGGSEERIDFCVLSSAFSLSLNLLLTHMFTPLGKRRAISTILSQGFWFNLVVAEEKVGMYEVYRLRNMTDGKNTSSVCLRSHTL